MLLARVRGQFNKMKNGPASNADAQASMRATSIRMRFSGIEALKGVDLSVEQGSIVGLIGPNGSGKTTLLNILSGVLAPTAGEVRINSVLATGWPAHRIAALGVARTFQNIRLFNQMTVLENVEVGAALDPDRRNGGFLRSRARSMLTETHLSDVADRRAGTLPYGLQRRVEIARALASKPTFLLLDEPAAGANEAESDELGGLIRSARDNYELGLLVVEHDLRLILRLSDTIVVLNDGLSIANGTAREVSNDPAVREAYLGRRGAMGGGMEVPA